MRIRRFVQGSAIFFTLLFGIGAAAYGLLFFTAQRAPDYSWFSSRPDDHQPLVMAHQGGEGEWPSNTLLAFEKSTEAGADVLDADVHRTKDRVLVLMHDPTVDRTTNGTGAIEDLTLKQIKQLDAAYRFTTDRGRTFPYRGRGTTVPTLQEFFEMHRGKRLGLEIKPNDRWTVPQQVCAVIRKYRLSDSVLVSSFRQENMDAFREACPEVATSATQDEVKLFIRLQTLRMTRILTPTYSSFQVPVKTKTQQVITSQFLTAAHERRLPILPWTINESEDMRRVIRFGVRGINTDYPTRLLEILRTVQ